MQDGQLFAGSIADNICFFDPQPNWDRIAKMQTLTGEQIANVSGGVLSADDGGSMILALGAMGGACHLLLRVADRWRALLSELRL